jgi:eukaryotic-like serine/threonine-protein kinase
VAGGKDDIGAPDPLGPTYSPSHESGSGPKKTPSFSNASKTPNGGAMWSSGDVAHPSGSVWVGRVLGNRWQVGDRIGAGGMATVHAGNDQRLGRAVAVKILHPHVAESPEARERLAREARAIAQLKHENVIEVYDYASDEPECTWLVTELIEGKSLRQFLDRHPRPMPEIAVMIVVELCRALRAAHEVGVIHRDVKPDNILVGKEGRPKLSDFGIAKVLNEAKMTVTGNLVGSPSYMSPEQADGLHTDHRTDLYSAGIVLYRLVTGTLPYRGATPLETIRKVARGEYQDPVEIAPESSGAVAGIIRRSLATNINERYQSADELLADLNRVLQDSSLSTGEELPKYFADPEGYQKALKPRLLKELEARGRALLDAGEEGRALDCFNRALSLGEGTQRTLDLVKELSKRRGKGKIRRLLAAGGLAAAAIAGVATVFVVSDLFAPQKNPAMAAAVPEAAKIEQRREAPAPKIEPDADLEAEPEKEAAPKIEAAKVEPEKDAAPKIEAAKSEAAKSDAAKGEAAKTEPEKDAAPKRDPRRATPKKEVAPAKVETPVVVAELPKHGTLQVGTKIWADVYVDNVKVGRAPERSIYPLPPGDHQLRMIQPDSNCFPFEQAFTIRPGETTRLRVQLVCP